MKTTSSNHFKAIGGGKEVLLSRPIYLTTLGFVLVIYLNEIMPACDKFYYLPRLEFCLFFFDAPCDNSGVLWLRSGSEYNNDSSYKLLTNKSHVLGVPISNFWSLTQ